MGCMQISYTSPGAWRLVSDKVAYEGSRRIFPTRISAGVPIEQPRMAPLIMKGTQAYGVEIKLSSDGLVGTPDFFTALYALVSVHILTPPNHAIH